MYTLKSFVFYSFIIIFASSDFVLASGAGDDPDFQRALEASLATSHRVHASEQEEEDPELQRALQESEQEDLDLQFQLQRIHEEASLREEDVEGVSGSAAGSGTSYVHPDIKNDPRYQIDLIREHSQRIIEGSRLNPETDQDIAKATLFDLVQKAFPKITPLQAELVIEGVQRSLRGNFFQDMKGFSASIFSHLEHSLEDVLNLSQQDFINNTAERIIGEIVEKQNRAPVTTGTIFQLLQQHFPHTDLDQRIQVVTKVEELLQTSEITALFSSVSLVPEEQGGASSSGSGPSDPHAAELTSGDISTLSEQIKGYYQELEKAYYEGNIFETDIYSELLELKREFCLRERRPFTTHIDRQTLNDMEERFRADRDQNLVQQLSALQDQISAFLNDRVKEDFPAFIQRQGLNIDPNLVTQFLEDVMGL